ncbi:protease [Streptomyces sp. NA02950]|uniref:protease n=1 Tax=Streptomyces sp. NA02950 TaxID=2742137 RepID=UPI00159202EA|nr:protease [Streptomyces sp. NA02950]QKV90991.1 protease [Streptomyces sp. NA02950]
MTTFLLAVHVLAAIIAVGPVTVAASMFPAAARTALSAPGDVRAAAVLRTLHRVCRVYAAAGVVVPVFGLATARSLGVLGDTWLIVSMVLTGLAAAVLAGLVLPRQGAVLAGLDSATDTDGATSPAPDTGGGATDRRTTARLAMYTGMFNLLWAVVTVLMIARPGSTTGA